MFRKPIYDPGTNCSIRAGRESGERGFTDGAVGRGLTNAFIFPTGN